MRLSSEDARPDVFADLHVIEEEGTAARSQQRGGDRLEPHIEGFPSLDHGVDDVVVRFHRSHFAVEEIRGPTRTRLIRNLVGENLRKLHEG